MLLLVNVLLAMLLVMVHMSVLLVMVLMSLSVLLVMVLMADLLVMVLMFVLLVMVPIAFVALLRWSGTPSWGRTLALGAAAGLAVSTKMSAIPFLGIAGVVILGVRTALARGSEQRARPPPRRE